ncbi:MAG: serine protease [Bacteroidales bacterium]|nr:serine protease [Bacteroidales bacterium]
MNLTNILKVPLALLISLMSFYTTVIAQVSLSKLFESTLPSIVKIQTFDADNAPLMSGTGFFISLDGKGISNSHVFNNAFKTQITTPRGEIYPIDSIWFRNDSLDLVIFKINYPKNKTSPFLKIAGNTPEIGEETFTIGNPVGLDFTISKGIISSIRNHPAFGQIIQTDAPISVGNSGSPLLNMDGMVIGVVTYTYTEGQNLNFALSLINRDLSKGFINTNLPRFPEAKKSIGKKPSEDDFGLVKEYHWLGCENWRFYIDFQKGMIGGPEWQIYNSKKDNNIPIESYVTGVYETINGDSNNVVIATMIVLVVDKNLTYIITFGTKYSEPSSKSCKLMITRITNAEPILIFDDMVEKKRVNTSDNRFVETTGYSKVSLHIEDQIMVRWININDQIPSIPFKGGSYFVKAYKIDKQDN